MTENLSNAFLARSPRNGRAGAKDTIINMRISRVRSGRVANERRVVFFSFFRCRFKGDACITGPLSCLEETVAIIINICEPDEF